MEMIALILFQIKHCVCDFVLQSEYQIQNKSVYGHRAGATHAATHVIGSLPALLLLTRQWNLIVACLAGEFVVHYHADWLKARFDLRRDAERDHIYWAVFGLDQLIHQLTYIAMLFVIVGPV